MYELNRVITIEKQGFCEDCLFIRTVILVLFARFYHIRCVFRSDFEKTTTYHWEWTRLILKTSDELIRRRISDITDHSQWWFYPDVI